VILGYYTGDTEALSRKQVKNTTKLSGLLVLTLLSTLLAKGVLLCPLYV
jgi:hypothetical protein